MKYGASVTVLTAFVVGVLSGCVYYNTFFNAKKYYDEGMEAKEKAKSDELPQNAEKAFDSSIEKSLKVIRDYPDSKYVDDAILLMGKALFEKGSYYESIQTMNSLLDNYPDSKLVPQARFYLGQAYKETDENDNAIVNFQFLLDDYPEYSEKKGVRFQLARAQAEVERYGQAVKNLELFLEKVENRALRDQALFLLARCHFHLGEYDVAMETFRTLARQTSSFSVRNESYFWLASSLSKAGDHERAIETIDELVTKDLDPEDLMKAQEFRAEELSLLGRIDESLEEYKKLAIGFPETETAAKAWYHCGLIELEVGGDIDEAKKHFMSAYREAPQSTYGLDARQMAVELTRYGRMEEIIEGDESEKKPVALFLKGEFLFLQMKDYDLALEAYAKLLQNYPESEWAPKAAYAVAYIHDEELGDSLTADATYRQVIERYDGTRYADYARIMLGMDVDPKETAFYDDELAEEEMIPEYNVREDDLFLFGDESQDTLSEAESDSVP